MRSLQSHLQVNADAASRMQRATRVIIASRPGLGLRGGWCGEHGGAAPVPRINGVNDSLWRVSDYAHTDSPHSTGKQTESAQSDTSTQKTHKYTRNNMFTHTHAHTHTGDASTR